MYRGASRRTTSQTFERQTKRQQTASAEAPSQRYLPRWNQFGMFRPTKKPYLTGSGSSAWDDSYPAIVYWPRDPALFRGVTAKVTSYVTRGAVTSPYTL